MRVNVYDEEYASEVELVTSLIKDTDETAFGVRFHLRDKEESEPREHGGDNRVAITFWQKKPAVYDPKDYHARLLLTLRAAVKLIEERQREQK